MGLYDIFFAFGHSKVDPIVVFFHVLVYCTLRSLAGCHGNASSCVVLLLVYLLNYNMLDISA
jgi:hypothetical protein